jgi:hypothetical protein
MNREEAEQFLFQAGIRFAEEIQFRDMGDLDELESNTVSVDSTDDKEDLTWEYGDILGEEEDEEEHKYNDPTPSMKAYALKYWHYPRVSDAECSSDSESDSEEANRDCYPHVSAIRTVQVPSLRRQCQNRTLG